MRLLTEARQRISLGARKSRRYQGRQVCADTDLHERALKQLKHHANEGARVVDVGCGRGAFSVRLADAGFAVVGLDLVPAAEQSATRFAYFEVDLFDPTARAQFVVDHGGSFDVVVLLEVIEHVHDPWETLRFARQLLRDGGMLLLSTPNITSFYSRFLFLISGRLHQFEQADLEYGHINPMSAMMVRTVLSDTGFELIDKAPGPPMPVLVWASAMPTLRWRLLHTITWIAAAAFIPLMRGGNLDGWSLFFVARVRLAELGDGRNPRATSCRYLKRFRDGVKPKH
jgi:SAM-dependent methyltransferase